MQISVITSCNKSDTHSPFVTWLYSHLQWESLDLHLKYQTKYWNYDRHLYSLQTVPRLVWSVERALLILFYFAIKNNLSCKGAHDSFRRKSEVSSLLLNFQARSTKDHVVSLVAIYVMNVWHRLSVIYASGVSSCCLVVPRCLIRDCSHKNVNKEADTAKLGSEIFHIFDEGETFFLPSVSENGTDSISTPEIWQLIFI